MGRRRSPTNYSATLRKTTNTGWDYRFLLTAHKASKRNWASSSGSSSEDKVLKCCGRINSKASQKACEVKRSGGKVQSEDKTVRRYQSATSVLGPG